MTHRYFVLFPPGTQVPIAHLYSSLYKAQGKKPTNHYDCEALTVAPPHLKTSPQERL